jgi:hypothetical protein
MSPHADTNWWDFTIDSNKRNKTNAIIHGDRKVNPETADGRNLLDYHQYIGLDKLLDCQIPSSRIPDERIFIITHQLFELVFKQMIFDLAVIAETFEELLSKDDHSFKSLCEKEAKDAGPAEDFWRPALHASGRLSYSSNDILPALLKYLDRKSSPDEDGASVELFHTDEFKKFRDNLVPASGFQTAQFRLIGRALGKTNLFDVSVFPSWKFQRFYLGQQDGDKLPLTLVDPLILRRGEAIATPPEDSALAPVAKVDDLAHSILARLAPPPEGTNEKVERINLIGEDDESTIELVESYLGMFSQIQRFEGPVDDASRKVAEASTKVFKETWIAAVKAENDRRRSMGWARKGADICGMHSYLARVLDRIVKTDRGMHGYRESTFVDGGVSHKEYGGFLAKHMKTAKQQIGRADGGTSGGGTLYLEFSIPSLFHNFPALVHYEHRVPIRSEPEES